MWINAQIHREIEHQHSMYCTNVAALNVIVGETLGRCLENKGDNHIAIADRNMRRLEEIVGGVVALLDRQMCFWK